MMTMCGTGTALLLLLAGSCDAFSTPAVVSRLLPLHLSADSREVLPPQHTVIVGGGWGGFGAARALVKSGASKGGVTLLDALPDPTGAKPYVSSTGKPVEAGTRGFWFE